MNHKDSEVNTAIGNGHAIDNVIDESNDGFSRIVSKYVNDSKSVIYKKVQEEYQIIANKNVVAAYNIERLFSN